MVFDKIVRIIGSVRQPSPRQLAQVTLWKAGLLLISGILTSTLVTAEELHDLSTAKRRENIRDVRVVTEVTGELKLNAEGKQISRLPLRASGESRYDERTLSDHRGTGIRRDARYYHNAQALLAIGESRTESTLSETRRLIMADVTPAKQILYSPLGPLTRDELELIHSPGSSSLLDRLAPNQPVAVGAEWTHDESLLAPLLGLDAVSQADVKSTLRQVEEQIAIIEMSGTVGGAIDGISSDINLRAKYNINLKSHQVTWLAMSIHEVRAIGHATPGFDVTARIRVAIADKPASDELADELLRQLPLERLDGAMLLSLPSAPGGFQLLHARTWQVMVDRHDVTILRLIDQGDLVAQCNISSLPDLPPGKRAQLATFQADIERALGKNFGQFVEASQQPSEQGLRVMRVVVAGLTSELPIQWIYYHLSNDAGRQASLVFTMDAKLVEKFGAADIALVSSFEFADRPAVAPTPARPNETATKPDDRAATLPR